MHNALIQIASLTVTALLALSMETQREQVRGEHPASAHHVSMAALVVGRAANAC